MKSNLKKQDSSGSPAIFLKYKIEIQPRSIIISIDKFEVGCYINHNIQTFSLFPAETRYTPEYDPLAGRLVQLNKINAI